MGCRLLLCLKTHYRRVSKRYASVCGHAVVHMKSDGIGIRAAAWCLLYVVTRKQLTMAGQVHMSIGCLGERRSGRERFDGKFKAIAVTW